MDGHHSACVALQSDVWESSGHYYDRIIYEEGVMTVSEEKDIQRWTWLEETRMKAFYTHSHTH